MVSNISGALNAYQQALGRIGGQIPVTESPKAAASGGFKDMVGDVLTTAVDLNKHSENMSMSAITGKADIQDVVMAVANAETALETVIAVRDTAIKAYKEIMSMPI